MANSISTESLLAGIQNGSIVPYLGAGALKGSTNKVDQTDIPADSDSLILSMNNGQAMVPKLMYEFPRAAMHLELKRGRSFITKFLTKLYQDQQWSTPELYKWLYELNLPYLIDSNRDILLQNEYAKRAHNLVLGCARIGGTEYRFKIFEYDMDSYKEVDVENVNASLPTLFKPMGSPVPEPNFIASDADYVDYITELMGGFAIPKFLKDHRLQKQYLYLGMRFTRDTERMVMSDITWGADKVRGWAVIPEPTEKEKRFCARIGIEIIETDIDTLFNEFTAQEVNKSVATA